MSAAIIVAVIIAGYRSVNRAACLKLNKHGSATVLSDLRLMSDRPLNIWHNGRAPVRQYGARGENAEGQYQEQTGKQFAH